MVVGLAAEGEGSLLNLLIQGFVMIFRLWGVGETLQRDYPQAWNVNNVKASLGELFLHFEERGLSSIIIEGRGKYQEREKRERD